MWFGVRDSYYCDFNMGGKGNDVIVKKRVES